MDAAHNQLKPLNSYRWAAEEPMRFESLPWCETPDTPHNDVNTMPCTLYRDHAGSHSWDVFDPEEEALRRTLTDSPEWPA
jgi:hypothetical protein